MTIRRFLPLLLIVIFAGASLYVIYEKPEVKKRPDESPTLISVETMTLAERQFQIRINSFGRVQPHTQGQLVSQVSGQIVALSPNFQDGGFFQKDEVLAQIDARDYQIQVEIAAAELADAKVDFAEQQVLAKQAAEDRKLVRNKGAVSDFALNIPQLAAAEARIAAANARLAQTKLDVERTQIRAPYSGRILSKNVGLGEVVSANTSLAKIYAVDLVEVRLPIKNSELAFLDLPEQYASGSNAQQQPSEVVIGNSLGGDRQLWPAKLVSTAGAIDEQSQQLYVTARIEHPYQQDRSNRRPLKIGQYVTAEIEGKQISDALVIPNAAVYQGSYVYIYEDGLLQRREIDVAWQSDNEALIRDGLGAGDRLVLTPLGQVSSGTRVKLLSDSGDTELTDSRGEATGGKSKQPQLGRKAG